MAKFDKGVRFYTKATAEVNFPEDDVCCRWCPLMGVEMAANRKYCKLSGELLLSPDTVIGFNCPLHFEEKESEEEEWNPLESV